jgi:hypothetical protein
VIAESIGLDKPPVGFQKYVSPPSLMKTKLDMIEPTV